MMSLRLQLKKQFWAVLFTFLLFFYYQAIAAQSDEKPHHILFIGNSYTYINSLPQMFKALAESQFPDDSIEVKFIGGGGATLKQHWEVGQALKEIQSGYWDIVVLQGQSLLGTSDLAGPDAPKRFYKYARKLDVEIKMSGAKTVFFMTWARKYLPQQQKYLTNAYQAIANELESKIAPVGLVWEKFRMLSDSDLYRKDKSHPSVSGTYLSALTLFAALYDFIPEKPPVALYGHEILRGGKLSTVKTCLCDLSEENVKLLRQAVVDVLSLKENKEQSMK